MLDPSCVHGLAAVRGLGRAGWRVVTAGFEPRSQAITAQSRFVEAHHRLPPPNDDAAAFGAGLARVLEETGAQAIVAAFDATIARLRTVDPSVPCVPVLDAALDAITDKVALAAIARDAGVLYPATWRRDQLDAVPRGGALIVKPRRTAVARQDRVVARTGAFVVHDEAGLRAAIDELEGMGLESIVQARVERAFKVNVSIVRSQGRTTARIAYDVVREYPPAGGRAAATQTLDPRSEPARRALEAAERVCDAAGYGGIANVEFYGQADGELCLLEVNTRIWGSTWLPEVLGLEVTARAVEHALGMPPRPPRDYPAGRRFHRTTLELRWLLSGSPDRGPRRAMLGTFGPRDVVDVFSFTDPRPVLATGRRLAGLAVPFARSVLSGRRRQPSGRSASDGPAAGP